MPGKRAKPIAPNTLSTSSYYRRRDSPIFKLAERVIAFGLEGEICFSDIRETSKISIIYSTFAKKDYVRVLQKRIEDIRKEECKVVSIKDFYVEKSQVPRVEEQLKEISERNSKNFLDDLSSEIANCELVLGENHPKIVELREKVPDYLRKSIEGMTSSFVFFECGTFK